MTPAIERVLPEQRSDAALALVADSGHREQLGRDVLGRAAAHHDRLQDAHSPASRRR